MPATKGSSTSPNSHISPTMTTKTAAQNSSCCRMLMVFTAARMPRRPCSIFDFRRIHVAHPSAQIESDRQERQDNHEPQHDRERRLCVEVQCQRSELKRREDN